MVLRSHVRVKRRANGRTLSPGWRKWSAYRQTGLGGLPLARRLSERLGRTRATLRFVDPLFGLRMLGECARRPPGTTDQLAATVWTNVTQFRVRTL